MANCHKCWWADFNPDSPTKHTIHEEPDYFNMAGPFAEAPMIRIVQSCGKGQTFFKTYGKQDHNCPKFSTPEAHQAELDKQIAAEREKWEHPTSRIRMEAGSNGFAAISVMQEGDNDAYNYLVDLMFYDLKLFTEIVIGLDDMNIRGRQLAMVFDTYEGKIVAIAKAVKDRDYKLVKWLNTEYDKSNEEEAVVGGAHLYGHKDNPNGPAGKSNDTRSKKLKSARGNLRSRREVTTTWRRGTSAGTDDLP